LVTYKLSCNFEGVVYFLNRHLAWENSSEDQDRPYVFSTYGEAVNSIYAFPFRAASKATYTITNSLGEQKRFQLRLISVEG
jgi:hypothetical protein